MKRTFPFLLAFLLLFSFSACNPDRTEEKILAHLALPLEFDCNFSIDTLDGKAHFSITEELFSIGITDGPANGLVLSLTEGKARFLYRGMDVTFPEKTTEKLLLLRKAFSFLQEQTYDPNAAERKEGTLLFTFRDENNTISYQVTEEGSPLTLILASQNETLKIEIN